MADTVEGADVDEATRLSNDVLPLRICTVCGKALPLASFYRDRHCRDGYRRDCKRCVVARQLRYQQQNADSYRAYQRQWRTCNKRKTLDYAAEYRAANPDKIRSDMERYRLLPEPRRIAKERARAFRLANPLRRAEYERRRRARERSSVIGRITVKLLAAKFAYWGNCCWMCGGPGTHVDHVKPLAKGGPHVLANIRPACGSCNGRKRDRWPFPTTGRPYECLVSPG